jgi:hypothetical protein
MFYYPRKTCVMLYQPHMFSWYQMGQLGVWNISVIVLNSLTRRIFVSGNHVGCMSTRTTLIAFISGVQVRASLSLDGNNKTWLTREYAIRFGPAYRGRIADHGAPLMEAFRVSVL